MSVALAAAPAPAAARPSRASFISDYLLPAAVLLTALVLAGCQYRHFLDRHRALWYDPAHDRNAHYLYSLKLATDIQYGRPLRLLADLNEGRVWPPLHASLAAGVLVVGGRDYRLAVLPSLAAWVGAVLFTFLAVRRAAPRGGNLAGLVAALFFLASPAHRAFATDVMLESLGACLTLAVLYCYQGARQAPAGAVWPGRWLGLTLTLLFLEKYNYWLLVVLALAAAEFLAQPQTLLRSARDFLTAVPWRRWAAAQLRHPLTYPIAALVLLAVLVGLRGDRPVVLAGHSVSLHPPHNIIGIAYALLFLRLLPWWWRSGREWVRRLDTPLRQVVRWHVCFLAVWFLLPKHLSYFLWFISLANARPDQHPDLLTGIQTYSGWLVEQYHLGLGTALLAAGLCLLGLLTWRRLRPGGRAVLLLLLIAAPLTAAHPNRLSRNVHSWLAAGWMAAGLGLAGLVYGRATARWPRSKPWLAGAAAVGLGAVLLPAGLEPGHAASGGPHQWGFSTLPMTDAYLADLDDSHKATILTAVTLKPQAQWTFVERFGGLDRLEEHWYGFGALGADNRLGFLRWLQTTDCDTLVYVDGDPRLLREDHGPECALHGELKDLLRIQSVFHLVRRTDLPLLSCSVELWRRTPSPPADVQAASP